MIEVNLSLLLIDVDNSIQSLNILRTGCSLVWRLSWSASSWNWRSQSPPRNHFLSPIIIHSYLRCNFELLLTVSIISRQYYDWTSKFRLSSLNIQFTDYLYLPLPNSAVKLYFLCWFWQIKTCRILINLSTNISANIIKIEVETLIAPIVYSPRLRSLWIIEISW